MRRITPPLRGGFARLALLMTVASGSLIGPFAAAQGTVPQPAIPQPPISQAATYRYNDSDGPGTITIANLGPDTATNGDQIAVSLFQNGATYNGTGLTYLLDPRAPVPRLIIFSVIAADGTSYFFQGIMTLGVETSAHGTYHPTLDPSQATQWSLIFLPGVQPPPAQMSGIRGVAMAGPISPVERPGVPNTRPLPYAVITIQPAGGGAEITRQVADANGQFQILLNPGTYLMVPLPPQPGSFFPRGTPQTVTVPPGAFLNVVAQYDTGIR